MKCYCYCYCYCEWEIYYHVLNTGKIPELFVHSLNGGWIRYFAMFIICFLKWKFFCFSFILFLACVWKCVMLTERMRDIVVNLVNWRLFKVLIFCIRHTHSLSILQQSFEIHTLFLWFHLWKWASPYNIRIDSIETLQAFH